VEGPPPTWHDDDDDDDDDEDDDDGANLCTMPEPVCLMREVSGTLASSLCTSSSDDDDTDGDDDSDWEVPSSLFWK